MLLRPRPAGRGTAAQRGAPAPPARRRSAAARLLLSAPILLLLLFYMLMAMVTSGVHSFSVTTLVAVQGIELGAANSVLTAFLVTSSAGILLGGILADRTRRYVLITSVAFGAAGLLLLLPALMALPALALIAAVRPRRAAPGQPCARRAT